MAIDPEAPAHVACRIGPPIRLSVLDRASARFDWENASLDEITELERTPHSERLKQRLDLTRPLARSGAGR